MAKELKYMGYVATVVLALAAIVLVALAITGEYGVQLRTETDTTIADFNLTATTTSVGTTGQYPYLQALTGCYNSSNSSLTLATTLYTVNEGNTDGGSVTLDASASNWINETINCSTLTYLADSSGSNSADKFVTGLGIFGAFTSVIVLAMVGLLIIKIFKKDDY